MECGGRIELVDLAPVRLAKRLPSELAHEVVVPIAQDLLVKLVVGAVVLVDMQHGGLPLLGCPPAMKRRENPRPVANDRVGEVFYSSAYLAANQTACARFSAPSVVRAASRWKRTVRGAIPIRSAVWFSL